MMMSVSNISKSFGAHSDHSLWHGKLDENCSYISRNGYPLRSESEAYTLTMCINKCRKTKKLVEISWYDKTKIDADNPHGKLLYQCVTKANTVHFQFPGSQANGVVHAGDWVANPEWNDATDIEEHAEQDDQSDEDWRIVVSFRENVSSSSCPACYLKRFDVLKMHGCQLIGKSNDWWTSILNSIEQGEEPDKCRVVTNNEVTINKPRDESQTETGKPISNLDDKHKYFLNHFKNRDQYKNCSQEEVKKFDIPVQDTYICEESCLSDTYNTYDYVCAMLKKCIVPNVSYVMEMSSSIKKKKNKLGGDVDKTSVHEEDTGVSNKPVTGKVTRREGKTTVETFPPLLYRSRGTNRGREYFMRDRIYPLDTVFNCAKINWSKKMDKQQELKPPLRTEDWRIFNTFICHRKYKNSKASLIELFTNPNCIWVDVIGSGGSPSKMDKNGADWQSVLKDKQDVAHLPHPQYLNDMNSTMIQAAQNNRPVAVFIGQEVYDDVWNDPMMVGSMSELGIRKEPVLKDNLYFLGYFHCIQQHSKKGMKHSKLVEEAEGETSIDTQRLMRFREMPNFRLFLELIPDRLLDVLPVRDDKDKGKLVHHGKQLKELLVQYDPHERIRYPADRQNITRHMSLGIEKPITKSSKKTNKIDVIEQDSESEGLREQTIPESSNDSKQDTRIKPNTRLRKRRKIVGDNSHVNETEGLDNENHSPEDKDIPQGMKIETITRLTLIQHHMEKEVMGNSMACRDVVSDSTNVPNRKDLPQPIFKKLFSSQYTHDDHLWLLETRKRLNGQPKLLRDVLKHTGLDSITNDPEWQNFKYDTEGRDVSTTETEDHVISSVKWSQDLMTRTKDEMVKMKEVAESMVFVSAGVLYRSMRSHIVNGLAFPLSNRCLGSKIQLYPTKSPNSILDMGRFTLRNELIRHLRQNLEQPINKSEVYTPQGGMRDRMFLNYCFKSFILTFNGRPSVIHNYFVYGKNQKGGAIPTPDEIDHFLDHLSLNVKHGTADGGIFNQQWSTCPELNTLQKYKDFIRAYASIHEKRFLSDVLELSVDSNGIMNRKMVLDNWVKLASSVNHRGAGTTLKFRFHIHQAMLNIENVFGRLFGEETLESVCVYHGSKEGWNKLHMNDEMILMKSSISDPLPNNKKETRNSKVTRNKSVSNQKPNKRTVKLDDDSIRSMSDLMSDTEYQHLMTYFKSLNKEQLAVLLIEKDKKGELRNIINGLSIGPSFLEHVLCILQYYLRRLSSGYNVSQRNEFDRPNFQPLKFNCNTLLLNEDNDPPLWNSLLSGLKAFEEWAGKGKDWKDVIHHPPDLFMVEEELELIYSKGKKTNNKTKPKKGKSKNTIDESVTTESFNETSKNQETQQQTYYTRGRTKRYFTEL
jgi:hypothetical protein